MCVFFSGSLSRKLKWWSSSFCHRRFWAKLFVTVIYEIAFVGNQILIFTAPRCPLLIKNTCIHQLLFLPHTLFITWVMQCIAACPAVSLINNKFYIFKKKSFLPLLMWSRPRDCLRVCIIYMCIYVCPLSCVFCTQRCQGSAGVHYSAQGAKAGNKHLKGQESIGHTHHLNSHTLFVFRVANRRDYASGHLVVRLHL